MIGTVGRLLPPGTRRRAAVFAVVPLLVGLVLLRVALPGGTPYGVLALGAVVGAEAAMIAAGMILVYRSARVVNFAQAALGLFGAQLAFNMAAISGVPFPIALVTAVAVSAIFAVVVELLFVRRFFRSPRLVLTVVTIVLPQVIRPAGSYIDKFPFWPHDKHAKDLHTTPIWHGPWRHLSLKIEPLTFRFPDFFTVGVALVAFVLLAAFLRYSKMGTAIRGTAENADRALMLGINVGLLSTVVWAIAGVLSSLTAVSSSLRGQWPGSIAVTDYPFLIAVTGAVLARFRSLPIALVACVGTGMVVTAFSWSYPASNVFLVAVFAIVVLGLLVQRERGGRVDEGLSSSWKATEEVRPTPRALLAVPGVRRMRRLLVLAIAAVVLVYPQMTSPGTVALASMIPIYGLIALSLVVLTGWGGQVSLGQAAFYAIGASTGAILAGTHHLPIFVAMPAAAIVTAGVAVAVGLPALRLRGAFLAVTTLLFSVVTEKFLLDYIQFPALDVDNVPRPRLLFLSLASERSFYYFAVAVLAVAAVVVRRLRAGRPGRVLIALREDERGVKTFAIDVVRTRLSIFVLSGMLAGVAGYLFVLHDAKMPDAGSVQKAFGAELSIKFFIMAMIGGISSVSGAVLGATFYGLTTILIKDQQIQRLTQGMPLLFLLFVSPGGLAAAAYGLRDSVLRIVALRRRMIVPSLFADVDPEVVLARKTPLAEAAPGRGLDALPATQRYEVDSELYPRRWDEVAVTPGASR